MNYLKTTFLACSIFVASNTLGQIYYTPVALFEKSDPLILPFNVYNLRENPVNETLNAVTKKAISSAPFISLSTARGCLPDSQMFRSDFHPDSNIVVKTYSLIEPTRRSYFDPVLIQTASNNFYLLSIDTYAQSDPALGIQNVVLVGKIDLKKVVRNAAFYNLGNIRVEEKCPEFKKRYLIKNIFIFQGKILLFEN